jgi:hypothetical protein
MAIKPPFLWTKVINVAIYFINYIMSKSLGKMSPKHVYTREPPRLGHLKVFKCLTYIHVPKVRVDKLEPRTIKGIFIGYNDVSKEYRIYNP